MILPKNNFVPKEEKFKFTVSQWWGEDWKGEIEGDIDDVEDLKTIIEDEARLRGMDSPQVTLYRWIPAPNDEWEEGWMNIDDAWMEHELDEWIEAWEEKGIAYKKSDFKYTRRNRG